MQQLSISHPSSLALLIKWYPQATCPTYFCREAVVDLAFSYTMSPVTPSWAIKAFGNILSQKGEKKKGKEKNKRQHELKKKKEDNKRFASWVQMQSARKNLLVFQTWHAVVFSK